MGMPIIEFICREGRSGFNRVVSRLPRADSSVGIVLCVGLIIFAVQALVVIVLLGGSISRATLLEATLHGAILTIFSSPLIYYLIVRPFTRALSQTMDDLQRALSEKATQARDLAAKKFKLDIALNNMLRGISMFDAEQKLVMCNSHYRDVYGLPETLTQPGTDFADILRFDTEQRHDCGTENALGLAENWLSEHQAKLASGETFSDIQHLADGRILKVTFQPLSSGGWVDTQEDITERHKAEDRIKYLALHDVLTGLANRMALQQHLERLLTGPRSGRSFAVMFLDLDGFKGVNDTLGHAAGDRLLKEVAERLQECIRDGDFVARLGGDEFAVVQADARSHNQTHVLATRLLEAINAPFDLGDQHAQVGTSIGIALAPNDGEDADTLLANADLALYRSKALGRGRYSHFDQRLAAVAQERFDIERDLRSALDAGQFELYYQPLVNAQTSKYTAFEALIRWNHPERGLVSPHEFVPLAEDTGVIGPIGTWVLREACKRAKSWPDHLRISVNVSPAQLKQSTFSMHVISALQETGLPPERLELEITETMLIDITPKLLEELNTLRDLGVRLVVDDFGTGYSCLHALHTLPIDKIKIDRLFVRDLETNESAQAIIRAITELGHALDLTVCVEGVETREQLDAVLKEGCGEIQGYLFGKPRPATEIDAEFEGAIATAATPNAS